MGVKVKLDMLGHRRGMVYVGRNIMSSIGSVSSGLKGMK
jgi:hypothetical protein